MKTAPKQAVKGGAFLIEEADPNDIFTPEDFDDELRMHLASLRHFIKHEALDTISMRREIAQAALKVNGYPVER